MLWLLLGQVSSSGGEVGWAGVLLIDHTPPFILYNISVATCTIVPFYCHNYYICMYILDNFFLKM